MGAPGGRTVTLPGALDAACRVAFRCGGRVELEIELTPGGTVYTVRVAHPYDEPSEGVGYSLSEAVAALEGAVAAWFGEGGVP